MATQDTSRNESGFSNGKWHKYVTTVGEMIAELSRLDPELAVRHGFDEGADLVVFNRTRPDAHLTLEDGHVWDEEDFEDDIEDASDEEQFDDDVDDDRGASATP